MAESAPSAVAAPAAPSVDAGYVARVVAVLALGWAVVYADRTALYPLLPTVAGEFRLSAAQTGATTSAYFVVYALAQIPAGAIGDRFGLRRVLAAMCFLAGLGLLALATLAGSYLMVLAAIALHGLGAGAYYPTAYGTAMQTIPAARRGLSAAIVNSGMAVGLATGLAASGPLFLATQQWRFPFLVLAAPTLLLGAVYLLVLRERRPEVHDRGSVVQVLGDRDLIFLGLINFCCLYGFWTAVTWGPTFFQTERGLGLGVAGAYTAIVAVVSIPSALVLARLSDRFGRRRFGLLLFPISAAAIAGLALADSLPGFLVALIVYGLAGKLVWDPIGAAWAADLTAARNPRLMGSAMGFYNLAGMSSAIVAPVVSGWIKDATGSLEGAFYLGAAFVAVAFLMTWLPREGDYWSVKPEVMA